MPTARYPLASWRGDGKTAGPYTTGPWKLVIHTTETPGVPGYGSGLRAPHITYFPRERRFYQHTSFLTSARSLRNESGGVETNRDSAIQLEIVAYAQESIVDQYPNTGRVKISELAAENLADIREFILWVCDEFGVGYVWPGRVAKSYGQANSGSFRMSNADWDNYNGVCGHQHVPESDHWDPGGLNWSALMEEDMPSNEEINTIVRIAIQEEAARSVWAGTYTIPDPVTGAPLHPNTILRSIRSDTAKLWKKIATFSGGATAGAVASELIRQLS